MIDYVIAAAIIGVAMYFYCRHRCRQESGKTEPEICRSADGFDYEAAKEQNDRQRALLQRYADASQMQDDVAVAMQSGEDLVISLSINSHCGEIHSVSASVHPDLMQDIVREILDNYAAECVACCSTSLPENYE